MGSLVGFKSLSDSGEFSSVYRSANKWHCDACVLFYKPSGEKKVAVVASKKVGKAVVRNRSKRLLRAAFVEVAGELQDGVYIMIAKSDLHNTPFTKIKKSLAWSLKKLRCIK